MINYSFIIPHKNNPDLLCRCLNTIPSRDDVQIIVVDDNSETHLRPESERTDVEIVFVNASESRGGAGYVRNVGIKKAVGRWLIFADCDDFFAVGFIDALDKYKNEEIDVLYYNYYKLDSELRPLKVQSDIQQYMHEYDGSEKTADNVRYRNNPPWSKMVRREFVLKNDICFEEVQNGNDVLFSLFLASKTNRFSVISDKVYCYVVNQGSISNKKQNEEEILTRIIHIIKHNRFNVKKGHKEWNLSVFDYVLTQCKMSSFSFVFSLLVVLIFSSVKMYKDRNEWVNLLLPNKTI